MLRTTHVLLSLTTWMALFVAMIPLILRSQGDTRDVGYSAMAYIFIVSVTNLVGGALRNIDERIKRLEATVGERRDPSK